MALSELQKHNTILTIPGWHGSGPEHWQTVWEETYRGFRRVEQREWEHPAMADWVVSIQEAAAGAASPVFLVAHSMGCHAVAHWAAQSGAARIAGALLVAPPWFGAAAACPKELQSFLPMHIGALPFRSILVASENDPYVSIEAAARLARRWGSEFVDAGRLGHINAASGHGRWPEGERLLERLCQGAGVATGAVRCR